MPSRRPKEDPSWDEVYEMIREHPEGMMLKDIGKAFGITREAVRLIEKSALTKLKAALIAYDTNASDLANIFSAKDLGTFDRTGGKCFDDT